MLLDIGLVQPSELRTTVFRLCKSNDVVEQFIVIVGDQDSLAS